MTSKPYSPGGDHYFAKIGKDYRFYYRKTLMYSTTKLAFLVDIAESSSGSVILKHGDLELVTKYYQDMRQKGLAAGYDWDTLVVINQDDWKVKDINQLIWNSTYVEFWLAEKLGPDWRTKVKQGVP